MSCKRKAFNDCSHLEASNRRTVRVGILLVTLRVRAERYMDGASSAAAHAEPGYAQKQVARLSEE